MHVNFDVADLLAAKLYIDLQVRNLVAVAVRRRVLGLWYGVEDGYLRIELDDGSVLVVAASWEGCHVMVDPGVPATRKGRPTKEPPRLLLPDSLGATR